MKPRAPVEDGATAVHGISAEDLKDAPPAAEVLPKLREALQERRVVVYNADFDGMALHNSLVTAVLHDPTLGAADYMRNRWECAMERYAEFVGDLSEYHGSYRWQRLPGGDHTALGDARATLAVLREMAAAELVVKP
jgi:DNA polymerase-3 subunit epsilon